MVLYGTSGTFWKFYKNYLLFLVLFVIFFRLFVIFWICWYCLTLFQVELIPIRNEAELVVLFLCNYRDITAFKVRQHLSSYFQQQGDHLRQKLCISYKVDTIAISFVSIKW